MDYLSLLPGDRESFQVIVPCCDNGSWCACVVLMNSTATLVFILVGVIWFYAIMQRGMIPLPTTAVSSTVKDKGQNPAVAPKQFVKEELPEKSLKTFKDVKVCRSLGLCALTSDKCSPGMSRVERRTDGHRRVSQE